MRAIRDLLGGSRGATDAAGAGDHHAQHVIDAALLAEHQRDVAAACAAVGKEAHAVSADGAQDGQVAAI